MKKTYVFTMLFFFLFSSCATRVTNIETMKSFRDLCPEKKLSICSLELIGADAGKKTMESAGALFGLVGALVVAGINTTTQANAYSQELTREFHHIYEETLGNSGFFQLSSSEKLLFLQDGKPLHLNDMAKKNDLYACVKAVSYLGATPKQVVVWTTWVITKSSGENLEYFTRATSNEKLGLLPEPTDPELKPVILELARQNAQQFLVNLGEGGETGSCLKDSLEKKKALEDKQQGIEIAVLKAKDDSRFINNDNETVLDMQTNLMWAAKDNGSDIKWADAKIYCEN